MADQAKQGSMDVIQWLTQCQGELDRESADTNVNLSWVATPKGSRTMRDVVNQALAHSSCKPNLEYGQVKAAGRLQQSISPGSSCSWETYMLVASIVLAHLSICQQRLVKLLADGCLVHASSNEHNLLAPAQM